MVESKSALSNTAPPFELDNSVEFGENKTKLVEVNRTLASSSSNNNSLYFLRCLINTICCCSNQLIFASRISLKESKNTTIFEYRSKSVLKPSV